MGILDAYDTFVNNKCEELTQQNNTVQKLTESVGLSNLVGGVEDFISKGVVESLLDSPLRDLAEDVLAQTITDNARRLSQNIMNQISDKTTKTLADLRSTAFNAVFTTMTFKNDMVLYFASTIAEQAVEAIRDKRKTLISLKEAVRKLHNALLSMAGGKPFFSKYLADLRLALTLIDKADKQLALTRGAFFTNTTFPTSNFTRAQDLLSQAQKLIVPPVTGEEAEELNKGFLKGVLQGPSYGRQLAMLQAIPKLTMEMLGSYDLYALKVLKVNALLLGFQSTVQNLQEVTGGKFKDVILSHIDDARKSISTLVGDMSLQLNGNEGDLDIRSNYKPNPTKTSAKAIEWGVRVKAVEIILAIIDPNALQTLSISNNVLRVYNNALQALGKLDDRVTSLAILKATDGREEVGDIEADMVTFAFQANQAIVDSSLTEGQPGNFGPKTVITLGKKLNQRLQLSIDQDREVETILLRYIAEAGPLLNGVKQLGDSVFSLLDGLGMDRASDFLKRGSFGEFFAMSGRTATYVGAAVTGLSLLDSLLNTDEQRQCIAATINKIKVEETSKRLAVQRAVSTNFVKQQERNTKECETLKKDKAKTESCTIGLDIKDLKTNPKDSLFGAFRGIFGGDIADSMSSTGLGTGLKELGKNTPSLGGVVSGDTPGKGVAGVYSNESYANLAKEDSNAAAASSTSTAKTSLAGALNNAGVPSSESETLPALQSKASTRQQQDPDNQELASAIAEGKVAQSRNAEADSLGKNSGSKNNFSKFGAS